MSYDLDRSSGIFDQGLFGLADAYGDTADGLGSVESIRSVSPRTRNTAVRAMQYDLIVLGLLPTTAADGFIGPNTTTALARAIFALGLSTDPNSAVTHLASGAITVPDSVLEALHAAAQAGKFPSQSVPGVPAVPASVPAPTMTPQSVPFDSDIQTGPGKPPLIDAPTAPTAPPSGDGMMPATTTPSSSSKWVPIAVIAGGAVLVAGVAYIAMRKPKPKANRRRSRRARRAR